MMRQEHFKQPDIATEYSKLYSTQSKYYHINKLRYFILDIRKKIKTENSWLSYRKRIY